MAGKQAKLQVYKEIQNAIGEIALVYCLSAKDLCPFFSSTLCGQLALAGYSEEFVKETFDRMFESYLRIKKEKEESIKCST